MDSFHDSHGASMGFLREYDTLSDHEKFGIQIPGLDQRLLLTPHVQDEKNPGIQGTFSKLDKSMSFFCHVS